jgi:hypothetical protein
VGLSLKFLRGDTLARECPSSRAWLWPAYECSRGLKWKRHVAGFESLSSQYLLTEPGPTQKSAGNTPASSKCTSPQERCLIQLSSGSPGRGSICSESLHNYKRRSDRGKSVSQEGRDEEASCGSAAQINSRARFRPATAAVLKRPGEAS